MNYNSDVEKLSVDRSKYINPKILLEYMDDIKDKIIEAITNYENEIKRLEEENEGLENYNSDLREAIQDLEEEVDLLRTEILEDCESRYDLELD